MIGLWASQGELRVCSQKRKRLQQCCKCHEKLFGVCNGVANAAKNFLVFATVLQMPRKTFWCLQRCCKCHEKLLGTCNSVANAAKNFLVLATVLQMPQKTFWRLQHCCKHFRKASRKDAWRNLSQRGARR